MSNERFAHYSVEAVENLVAERDALRAEVERAHADVIRMQNANRERIATLEALLREAVDALEEVHFPSTMIARSRAALDNASSHE